ncbi:MAG: hypothetical protein ACI848_000479 [Roseivirga sp.]|jgi:hypothetical protein
MKKITLITALALLSITTISCKTDIKKEGNSSTEKSYSVEPRTTKISFTAYKTTEKIGVEGQFTKVNFNNIKKSITPREALNGTEFSIPISSLFTNNEDRDSKIMKLFFGVMDNTELLSGNIELTSDTEGIATIKMNNITKSFPVKYTLNGKMASFTGVLNVEDWNAQAALESLNIACFDLHKGADGISKTWSEVKIDIITYLKVQ